jgi:hypothetical protein
VDAEHELDRRSRPRTVQIADDAFSVSGVRDVAIIARYTRAQARSFGKERDPRTYPCAVRSGARAREHRSARRRTSSRAGPAGRSADDDPYDLARPEVVA